jgi:4-amino-4-deoxy-L-arabinose transferase-like glycosyltransferase
MGALLGFVASMVVPFLLGRQVVKICWPAGSRGVADPLLRTVTAFGVGLGLASVINFLFIVLAGKASRLVVVVELVVLVTVGAVARRCRRPHSLAACRENRFERISTTVSIPLAAIALATVGVILLRVPMGAWDAVAIWNMHAQFLMAPSAGGWKAIFDPVMVASHPDYPPLVPALVARGWIYVGNTMPLVPMTLAWSLTAALLALLTAAVALSRGRWQGALACAVMASSPVFLGTSVSQYADMPLAFFFLLSIALLHRADHSEESGAGLYVLAGLAAGMAALTKNEGILFLVALAVGRILYLVLAKRAVGKIKNLAWLVVGTLPLVAVLLLYKSSSPPNYLMAAPGGDLWKKLLSKPRALLILTELEREILQPHSFANGLVQRVCTWNWHLLATWLFVLVFGIDSHRLSKRSSLLAFIVVCVGMTVDVLVTWRSTGTSGFHWSVAIAASLVMVSMCFDLRLLKRPSFLAPTVTLIVVCAGYFLVYLATPEDLKWQLRFSIERLLFHVMPLTIFVTFLALPRWALPSLKGATTP